MSTVLGILFAGVIQKLRTVAKLEVQENFKLRVSGSKKRMTAVAGLVVGRLLCFILNVFSLLRSPCAELSDAQEGGE